MNKDQGSGIIERVVYGAVSFVVLRYGSKLGLTPDDAAWISGGAIALFGGAWAWWHNRPVSVLNRAGEAIPKEAKLVITATPGASVADRREVAQLGTATSGKVIAKP